ncbi:MAG: hypothetical protein WCX65_04305 [bacterium]
MRIVFIAVCAVIVFASQCSFAAQACNGSADLCGKRYDEVTYAGAHNAMSNMDERWNFPNQIHGLTRQLEDGVRWLSLDLYYFRDDVYMCHALCALGNETLAGGLQKVKAFMDAHPNEIVSFEFENYVSPKDTEAVFRAAGLAEMMHVQKAGQPWPTLGEMIKSGRRIVAFNGNNEGAPLLNSFSDFIGATKWHYEAVSQFDCGDPNGKSLYSISHFLTKPYAMAPLGRKANRESVIMNRALGCWKKTGRRPNVMLVDFYSIGSVIKSVRKLNATDGLEVDALLIEYGNSIKTGFKLKAIE